VQVAELVDLLTLVFQAGEAHFGDQHFGLVDAGVGIQSAGAGIAGVADERHRHVRRDGHAGLAQFLQLGPRQASKLVLQLPPALPDDVPA
jgi:hypothetical protein